MLKKISILLTLFLLLTGISTAAEAQGKTVQAQKKLKTPFIYATTLISVSSTTAELKFITQNEASTYIKYGVLKDNLDQTAYINDEGTYHYGAIKNLTPDTTYYYKIYAKYKNRVIADKTTYTLTTAPLATITGLQAYSTTDTKTKFEWFTNIPSDCILYYGTSPDELYYIAEKAETFSDTYHNAYAYNLQPNTTYYYMVATKDGLVKTDVQTFTTLDITKPVVVYDVTTYSTTETATKFQWYTSQPISCILYYGADPVMFTDSVVVSAEPGSPYLAFAGNLEPNTTYYYMIVTKDFSAKTDILSFTTLSAAK